MKLLKEYLSNSIEETDEIAEQLVNVFIKGSVVELVGNLGTGKTYFVKAFCKHIGIDNASSPSFSIVNEYKGREQVYHFDFYRIKKEVELFDIGFDEYINNENAITFIEWGDLYEKVLPKRRFKLSIILDENNIRQFKLYINE